MASPAASSIVALLQALRPHHWVKNLLVFAAPLFALRFDPATGLEAGVAFLAFSLAASGFYLVNDIADAEADRQHPVKCHRPIASGAISVPLALAVAVAAFALSLGASYWVSPLLALTVGLYAAVQTSYNVALKHEPILDIMCIAGGFVLRALGGAAATEVAPSSWFVLCVGLLAFYLGIEKRKAELKAAGSEGQTRGVLRQYSLAWLLRMENVVTASTLMAYALWAVQRPPTPWMLVTLPFVAYGLFRYQALSELGQGEQPEAILLGDRRIAIAVGLWLASCVAILFLTVSG